MNVTIDNKLLGKISPNEKKSQTEEKKNLDNENPTSPAPFQEVFHQHQERKPNTLNPKKAVKKGETAKETDKTTTEHGKVTTKLSKSKKAAITEPHKIATKFLNLLKKQRQNVDTAHTHVNKRLETAQTSHLHASTTKKTTQPFKFSESNAQKTLKTAHRQMTTHTTGQTARKPQTTHLKKDLPQAHAPETPRHQQKSSLPHAKSQRPHTAQSPDPVTTAKTHHKKATHSKTTLTPTHAAKAIHHHTGIKIKPNPMSTPHTHANVKAKSKLANLPHEKQHRAHKASAQVHEIPMANQHNTHATTDSDHQSGKPINNAAEINAHRSEHIAKLLLPHIENGKELITIKLHPEHLGTVKVHVQLHGPKPEIRIEAEHIDSEKIIQQHIPQLLQTLRQTVPKLTIQMAASEHQAAEVQKDIKSTQRTVRTQAKRS